MLRFGMRIAYIAPRWDYGDPDRGLSLEEVTFHSALRGLGHEIHHFDFMERAAAVGPDEMNVELLRFVLDCDPDLAFFVLFEDEIDFHTIEKITANGVVTLNWFTDDHWRFESFSRHYAPAFSFVCTTDEHAIEKYHSTGYDRVLFTQWACNRHAYKPVRTSKEHDVSFVGQKYGDRPKAVSALRRAGARVDCYGLGWDTGRLEHSEMVKTFGATRVNLNFAKAYRGRLWRRRPLTYQIKARVFEIAGCGGFVLTENAPHLDRYLQPGREIATFDDRSTLVAQARYWLKNEEERDRVARRGYERVMAEHTYEHRFEEIFRATNLDDC